MIKELKIMKLVDHVNVLKMHEIIDDEENDNLYLVLEYAQKGQSLDVDEEGEEVIYRIPEKVKPYKNDGKITYFSEDELREIMKDLVNGLEYRK